MIHRGVDKGAYVHGNGSNMCIQGSSKDSSELNCSAWCVSGGAGRVRASVIVHMDPHIKRVPSALINFVLKIMSPFLFNTIQNVLKSEFDSPEKVLPIRMREKPELYGLIAPRIDEYIHHLQEMGT